MGKRSPKPSMMRFEPESGWAEASGQVISMKDHLKSDNAVMDYAESSVEKLPMQALVDIGDSMQDVFESLKISDPRLMAWTQVNSAIRLISGKLQEKQALEEKIRSLESEIEGVRSLAAELVSNAYRSEQEIHETSKLRMQIAESLSEKLSAALKS